MAHPRILIEAGAAEPGLGDRLVRRRRRRRLPDQRGHAGAARRGGGARAGHRPARVGGGVPRAPPARPLRRGQHPALARRCRWAAGSSATTWRRCSAARARTPRIDGVYVADGAAAGRQPHLHRPRACRTAPATSSTRASWPARRKAVFNGRILVRPDAQKTDAKQTNRALLLSDDGPGQLQPAARDLRRRRQVHARRRRRPARRGRAVLPAGARAAAAIRPATCCSMPSPARCSARSRPTSCAARLEATLFARLDRDLADQRATG